MYDARGTKQRVWGKDTTGTILYEFDEFGFRKMNDYSRNPEYTFFGSSLLFGVGVPKEKLFTSAFNCWNFGLAGQYTEQEFIKCYESFKSLELKSKIVFVWRDIVKVPQNILAQEEIYHCLPVYSKEKNHLRLLENLDYDVSGTHWGAKTHSKFSTLLWHFLK